MLEKFWLKSRRMSAHQRSSGARVQNLAAVLAGKPSFWLVFIAAMFTWPIARSLQAGRALARSDEVGNSPVFGRVRPFTLDDPTSGRFGSAELHGRLWLASFAATDCAPMCDRIERSMARLEEVRHRTRNLGDAFRIVTFPVDPERTTAAQMRALSGAHRASRGPWRFVFGPPDRLRDILGDFRIFEGRPEARAALVDPELQIRGYYDLADEAALASLLHDISRLLTREANAAQASEP